MREELFTTLEQYLRFRRGADIQLTPTGTKLDWGEFEDYYTLVSGCFTVQQRLQMQQQGVPAGDPNTLDLFVTMITRCWDSDKYAQQQSAAAPAAVRVLFFISST